MDNKRFCGVYAAVLCPRFDDGAVDLASFRSLIIFLRDRGVTRFAVNGATGEFCLTTPSELRQVLGVVQQECGPSAEVLCGVGSAGVAGARALVRVAEQAKATGLLLPMPYFFLYSQDDLYCFSEAVAGSTQLPTLLYNLPQFTSGLEIETVCRLVEAVPQITGIKDSSGSLEIVTALTQRLPDACRILGNDGALAEALTAGVCDGVISGVACVLPELIARLYQGPPGSDAFNDGSARLNAFIDQLNLFPAPWGLKFAVEVRSGLPARFAQPLSDERKRQAKNFAAWFQDWLHYAQPGS